MKTLHIFLLLMSTSVGISQTWKSNDYFIKASYQYGYVFQTNQFISGTNPDHEPISTMRSGAIRFGIQSKGEKYWQKEYKNPKYGLQLKVVDFGEPEFIGTPIVVSGFFTAPFVVKNKLTFGYDVGLGAAFNWKPFNPVTNNTNLSIGAKESFYFDLGLFLGYSITKRLELETGINLTHYSSGALKLPNLGFNVVTPKLAFYYKLFELESNTIEFNKKVFKGIEYEISIFAASKNVIFDSLNFDLIEKYEGVNFPVFGISAAVHKRINYKSKIGFGATLGYNSSIDAQIAISEDEIDIVPSPFSDKLQLSIYPSYHLVAGPFTAIVQPSFYIIRKKLRNQTAFFYQRIGVRYTFKNNVFLGFNLRAYDYHVSDFIEWNIGFNINK